MVSLSRLGVVLSLITFKLFKAGMSVIFCLGVVLSLITFKQVQESDLSTLKFGSSAIFNYFQTPAGTAPPAPLFGSSAIFNYFQTNFFIAISSDIVWE